MQNKKTNLFQWATSELSQDAFLCWLLSWASPDYAITDNHLHTISKKFINYLTKNTIKEEGIYSIKIERQIFKIDIFVTINDCYYIIIEDKVNASETGDQLERYAKTVSEQYGVKNNLFLVYLKTGEQNNWESIEKKGYTLFLRKELLNLLQEGIDLGIKNNIYLDFYSHLYQIDTAINSYLNTRKEFWVHESWRGFYKDLEIRLRKKDVDINWQEYQGQFFWFAFPCPYFYKEAQNIRFNYYLELKNEEMNFKIIPYPKENGKNIRNYYRGILHKKANEHNIEITDVNSRVGEYMIIARIKESDIRVFNGDGIIDMDKTECYIYKILEMIKEIQ